MYLSRDNSDASQSTTTTDDGSSSTTTTTSTTTVINNSNSSNNTPPKEPVVPQRVTRSSQRFAQQNGDNNNSESKSLNAGASGSSSNTNNTNTNNGADNDNCDENNSSSTAANGGGGGSGVNNNSDNSAGGRQTSSDQSGRKAKRKKLEQQADLEQDANQQGQQAPMFMPEFNPADYQLPEFNSFELYRRQMRKRYKEIMCLNSVHAITKAPMGIKDYLLFNGPYLLGEDKLGVGLGGASVERSLLNNANNANNQNNQLIHHHHQQQQNMQQQQQQHLSVQQQQQQQLPRLKMKFSRTRSGAFKLLSTPQHQLANNHRLTNYIVPKLLDAPASLSPNSPLYELFQSQEKARHKMRMQHLKERERSILASEQEILRAYNQEFNLSACAYFHQQEKYHYVYENRNSGVCENLDYPTGLAAASATAAAAAAAAAAGPQSSSSTTTATTTTTTTTTTTASTAAAATSATVSAPTEEIASQQSQQDQTSTSNSSADDAPQAQVEKDIDSNQAQDEGMEVGENDEDDDDDDDNKTTTLELSTRPATPISATELEQQKVIAKLVKDLQELDDKWAEIKREMFIRHKNESDTLYAIQSLEWEWRAKETGACDKEFVPKVEVSALEY